jgi:transposase-like protein
MIPQNVVEQDHRGFKRITRSMMGFKSFDAGQSTLTGIELLRMIKNRQMADHYDQLSMWEEPGDTLMCSGAHSNDG